MRLPKKMKVQVSHVAKGPIRHQSFSEQFMAKLREVYDVFAEYQSDGFEGWVDDFKRDMNPDKELLLFEAAAIVYKDNITGAPEEVKREVYRVVTATIAFADIDASKLHHLCHADVVRMRKEVERLLDLPVLQL